MHRHSFKQNHKLNKSSSHLYRQMSLNTFRSLSDYMVSISEQTFHQSCPSNAHADQLHIFQVIYKSLKGRLQCVQSAFIQKQICKAFICCFSVLSCMYCTFLMYHTFLLFHLNLLFYQYICIPKVRTANFAVTETDSFTNEV